MGSSNGNGGGDGPPKRPSSKGSSILNFFKKRPKLADEQEQVCLQEDHGPSSCSGSGSAVPVSSVSDSPLLTGPISSVQTETECATQNAHPCTVSRSAPLPLEDTAASVAASQYDIGLYVGKRDTDDFTKCKLLESPWTPDAQYKFPRSEHTKLGKTVHRSINHTHLDRHHWLAVSDIEQGLFCKYCVLFATPEVSANERLSDVGVLVKRPLKSFSKLYGTKDGEITRHEQKHYHLNAVSKGKEFLHTYHNPSLNIINRLDDKRRAEAEENRQRLLPILQTIVFCGQQDIALRGHRDDGSLLRFPLNETETGSISENDGNFRALLRFRIDAGDKVLKKHLEDSSSRATYISKTTQNELIECCGEELCEAICKKIRKSPWFSVIFDETTDGSRKELMSVSIRYVHKEYVKGKGMVPGVREDFLCYVDCYQAIRPEDVSEGGEKRLTGKALGHIVVDLCSKFNLDLKGRCVGVGTDNCAVMASQIKGAVAEIQKYAPLAKRCPCLNHILNNSLKQSNNVLACKTAITKMKEIIAFSNGSAKLHEVFKRHLKHALAGLCETRWSEKHDGTLQFCQNLPQICAALEEISSWETSETSSKAHSLLKGICDSEFIISAFALGDILALTRPLSLLLQSPKIDSVTASMAVKDVLSVLEKKREEAEQSFNLVFGKASALASEIGVDLAVPRIARRQGNRANHPSSSPEEYYRRSIYVPTLDTTLVDLKDRLSDEVLESFNLRVLMPMPSAMDLDSEPGSAAAPPETLRQLNELGKFYDTALENRSYLLESEYTMWVEKWRRVRRQGSTMPETVLEALDMCDGDMFPLIRTLLAILATLPASVATAERSFSTLRRVKTWLRSRMGDDRLNGLCLLSVHRDIDISLFDVIKRFANRKNRRIKFNL